MRVCAPVLGRYPVQEADGGVSGLDRFGQGEGGVKRGKNGKQKKRNKPSGERVVSAQIDHVTIGGTTGKPVFDLCTETGNWYYSMEPEQFYLTREAAEAALKEQEG